MIQNILNSVNEFSDRLLLPYSSPNMNLVAEVLQYDAALLDSLSDSDLSKFIFVLGQYLVMLQYNSNLKKVDYLLLSKSLEHRVNIYRFSEALPKSLTNEKQRKSWIVDQDQEMSTLYHDALRAEAEDLMLDGMCKSVEALLNALKKEKSTRAPQGEY